MAVYKQSDGRAYRFYRLLFGPAHSSRAVRAKNRTGEKNKEIYPIAQEDVDVRSATTTIVAVVITFFALAVFLKDDGRVAFARGFTSGRKNTSRVARFRNIPAMCSNIARSRRAHTHVRIFAMYSQPTGKCGRLVQVECFSSKGGLCRRGMSSSVCSDMASLLPHTPFFPLAAREHRERERERDRFLYRRCNL